MRNIMRVICQGAVAPILLLAVVVGCAPQSVNEVKNFRYAGSDFTLGEALDNPSGCSSTVWKETVNENNRSDVEYICDVSVLESDILAASRKNAGKAKAAASAFLFQYKMAVDHFKSAVDFSEQSIASAKERHATKAAQASQALDEARAKLNLALEAAELSAQRPLAAKERVIYEVAQRKREVQLALDRLEELKSQDGGAEGSDPLRGYLSDQSVKVERLNQVLMWKPRVEREAAKLEEVKSVEIQEFNSKLKSRKLQLSLQFVVPKHASPSLQSAQWLVDGQPYGSPDAIRLAVVFSSPKMMRELVSAEVSYVFDYPDQQGSVTSDFPIMCWPKFETGCIDRPK